MICPRPHCESVWKRKTVYSSLLLPPAVWQPLTWRQGNVQAPCLDERVWLASLPSTPNAKVVLGLPPFPIRNSLALLLLALGQCTMVNRFSPPFTGFSALGLCPALHSAQLQPHPHPNPEIQMEEMVPLGTSLAGSKKARTLPSPTPTQLGKGTDQSRNPRTTLTTIERYGDYFKLKTSLPQTPTPTRKNNA